MARFSLFRRADVDMISGPLLKNIIKFAIPFVLSNLLQTLFNAADLWVVSRFAGSINNAAVGATGVLTHLIIGIFIGLGTGAGVVVAQSIGARDHDGVSKTVHSSMLIALLGGAILTVIGILFCGTFLEWLSTPSDFIHLSKLYMQIYFIGAIPMLVYNFGAAILRAAGDAQTPLYYLTIAGVINVVLNIIFVTVFKMTVDGVAWATTISQTFSAVMVVLALMKRDDGCRLCLKKLRIHKKQLLRILAIGLPSGLQGAVFSISNLTIQGSVNSFDNVAINSGHATAGNIEGFVYMMGLALQQTALNFMGQNVGARNWRRLRKIAWVCLACTVAVFAVGSGIIFLFGYQLLGFYIKDSKEAIEWGMVRFAVMCPSLALAGIMDVLNGALRGLGKATTAMLITVLGVCGFRVMWVFTVFPLPQCHTMTHLYLSFPISWTITLTLLFIAFMHTTKKLTQKWRLEEAADNVQA